MPSDYRYIHQKIRQGTPGVVLLLLALILLPVPASGQDGLTAIQPLEVVDDSAPGDVQVSLDYKNASLSTVIRTLAYTYDLNLVATHDLSGTVTLTLKDVTLDEALEGILLVNNYTFTRKGSLIYITPGPGLASIDMQTTSITMNYLAASEAERLIGSVLSERGEIQINEATNSLVITDYRDNIRRIESVLSDIDVAPVQVLIEAKIVDIQSREFKNMGGTYTLNYSPGEGLFDRSTAFAESLTGGLTLAGPSTNLTGGQISVSPTFKGLSGTATLDALIQKNKAHLLASPSIMTLNGHEARIIIGEKFPYKEQTQTTTGTTETTKFVDVGTTLRVTPQVSPDNWITMVVHPEVSSVSAALDAGPRITTREADATIRVQDGETIVIGGLINKQDDRIRGRVPWLNKVPIVGPLFFKQLSRDLQNTELAVFITPHIKRMPLPDEAPRPDIEDEEIFTNIESSGRLNLIAKLTEHARALEDKRTPESADKSEAHRTLQMLNSYKILASQFPGAPDTADALCRMADLYEKQFDRPDIALKIYARVARDYADEEFADLALYRRGRILYEGGNYDEARETFEQLIREYRDSDYRRKSRRYLKKIKKQIKKMKKQEG